MKTIRKAVIPAAGLGTRFLPATKAQPKEMLPILDKPSIQFIVEEAVAAGIESIMIVTGRNKSSIEDHFDKSFELETVLEERGKLELLEMVRDISRLADIHFIRQKEPLGLGHAILCARHFVEDEPFAVLLGDDVILGKSPAIGQLMEAYEKTGLPVIGVQAVDWKEVHKYGIVVPAVETVAFNRNFTLSSVIEKPERSQAPSNLAIVGRYVLTSDIFTKLEKLAPGKNGEYQLTDSLAEYAVIQAIQACIIQGNRYDIGDKLGYLQANIEYALTQKNMNQEVRSYIMAIAETLKFAEGQ